MAIALALFFWLMSIITVSIFIGRVWWPPELVSADGGLIDRQMVITLAIAGLVFFLAQMVLGYFIWRYQSRGTGRAIYWHESPKLELTWTIATAIVFIGIGINGNHIWAQYFADAPANAMTVEVTAQQFAWNIRYAGPDGKFGRTDPTLINDSLGNYLGLDEKDASAQDDIVTQNIIAVPLNRPVSVILRSKDVTHSFFVPQLRVKQDAVPGMAIKIHFTATKPGEYEVACAELCGMQHYKMRARLLVMDEAAFNSWLKTRAAA